MLNTEDTITECISSRNFNQPRTAWSLDDLRSCNLISQPVFVWTLLQVVLQIHEWLWEVSPQKWQKCVNLRDCIIWLEFSWGFQKGCEQKAWKHKQISGFCLTTEWNKIQKFVHAHRLMSRDEMLTSSAEQDSDCWTMFFKENLFD